MGILQWLDGYKTYIAGVAAIASGIGMVCTAVLDSIKTGYFNADAVWQGVVVIAGGFGMMGFRHALEKKNNTPQ